jgi:hypothetical protein
LTLQFDHVWVKIHKVELEGPNGSVTAFEDAAGKVIDLTTLTDNGVSRFALLGLRSVPAGNYSGVRVTMAEALTLVPKGQTQGVSRTFSDSSNGTKRVTFGLPAGTNITGTQDLVVDFDLSQWTDNGATVTAVVKHHNGQGLNDDARQEAEDFEGIASGLSGTAPNFTFDLAFGGTTLRVVTDARTSIFNSNGAPSPTLANGKRLEVRGVFDTTTRTMKATTVKVEDGNNQDEAEAEGRVGQVGANDFTLTLSEAEGFIPTSASLRVVTTAGTRYFSRGGIVITKAQFFAAISVAGQRAEAEGSYDAASGTITATKVKLEDGDDDNNDDGDLEVEGPAANVNAGAGTLSVTVQKWEGTVLTPGSVVNVVTTGGTEFRLDGGSNGGRTSKAEFFAALANGERVEVEGDLNGTTLTATKIKLEDDDDDDGDDD